MLKLKAKLDLEKILYSPNIAADLHKDDLKKIAEDVTSRRTFDQQSRRKWEHITKKVIKLASLEKERKDTPFENASNFKHPLIATAVIQLAARLYPEIVRNGEVVKTAVLGDDPDNTKHQVARVIADHMNYQFLIENGYFKQLLDKVLNAYGLVGVTFVKTYYDPIKLRNINEFIPYQDIVLNSEMKSLEDARRVTHVLRMHKNEILEQIRYGVFNEIDDRLLDVETVQYEGKEDQEVLEQHRYLDLDGDGYEEPYIVTVLTQSQEVLRIVARFDPDGIKKNSKGKVICIKPIHYFTDFHCMPNPDGSFYSLGLGHLLYNMTHTVNTLVNQQIDAGTLANLQTGFFGSDIRIKGGDLKVTMGQYTKLNTALNGKISDSIHPLTFKDPSPVLLQLLGIILAGAKELVSLTDTNMGQAQVQNVASSVMAAQLQEGTKVMSGIQDRTNRSLQSLFDKNYRLNSIFLDPQTQFALPGKQQGISAEDYKDTAIMIKPVADPNLSSSSERQRKAQAILEFGQNPLLAPHMNGYGVGQYVCDAFDLDNPAQLLQPPDPNAPPPPEILQIQSDMAHKQDQLQLEAEKVELQRHDVMIRAQLAESQELVDQAEAALKRAQAYAAAQAPDLERHKQAMDAIKAGHKNEMDIQKEHVKGEVAVKVAKAKPSKPTGA